MVTPLITRITQMEITALHGLLAFVQQTPTLMITMRTVTAIPAGIRIEKLLCEDDDAARIVRRIDTQ